MTVQPMLTGLETTRVSILMYHEAADRVWEQATLKYCVFLLCSPQPTTPKRAHMGYGDAHDPHRNRKPFRAPLQPRAPAGRTPLADRTTLSHSSQGHETQTNSPRLDTESLPTTPRPSTRCRPAPSPPPGRWCPQVEPSKTWKIRKFAQ